MLNAAVLYQGRGCGPGWDKWGQTRVKKNADLKAGLDKFLESLS